VNSIKPNSIVLLNVIRELCNEPDFQERLDSVLERIGDIESLGRMRELVWKSVSRQQLPAFFFVSEEAKERGGMSASSVASICVLLWPLLLVDIHYA
jgi:hypothetical protein